MKNVIQKLTMLALSGLIIGSCGRDNNVKDARYRNYAYGGRCGVAPVGGTILYSETGVGTIYRNNVPGILTLTIAVDQNGQVLASGSLEIPNADAFFSEGFGDGYYYGTPVRGPINTCLSSGNSGGMWDDFTNQTASPLRLIGGNVELDLDPGVYVSSNGLFATNGRIGLRGYMSGGEITITPGAGN